MNPYYILAGLIGLYALTKLSSARAPANPKFTGIYAQLSPQIAANLANVWSPNIMQQQLTIAINEIADAKGFTNLTPTWQANVKAILAHSQGIMQAQGNDFSRDATQNSWLLNAINVIAQEVTNGATSKTVAQVIQEAQALVTSAQNITGSDLTNWITSNVGQITTAVTDIANVISKASSNDQATLNQLKSSLTALAVQVGGAVASQVTNALSGIGSGSGSGSSDGSGGSSDGSGGSSDGSGGSTDSSNTPPPTDGSS